LTIEVELEALLGDSAFLIGRRDTPFQVELPRVLILGRLGVYTSDWHLIIALVSRLWIVGPIRGRGRTCG